LRTAASSRSRRARSRSLRELENEPEITRLLHPEVRYEVTDNCNATCIMCPRDKHEHGREHGIMDQAKYQKSIDEVVQLGARRSC
jgi:MoaA/NifB/PqqE/SkfB family radical SAM enzyme